MSTSTAPGTASGLAVYASSSVPTYDYQSFIQPPNNLGVSSNKSWKQFDDNLKVATNYGLYITDDQTLVTTTGQPLGMDYLLDTNTKCKAIDLSGSPLVERYVYIQNNNPGGMLDSLISDIEKGLSPNNLELAFTPSIDCQGVSLMTIDENGTMGYGRGWVAVSEISTIDPCKFESGVNRVTNQKCGESFVNYNDSKYDNNFIYDNNRKKKKKDVVESIYFTGIMMFGLYLIYCFMKKTK
jgi:hypothetical protein